jgi:hypothetical protein
MPRRADACAGCEHPFEPGELIQAYLHETGEGYGRRDYCLTCQPPSDPPPLGSWKTRRPEPSARKALRFDPEAIYGLFERLEDAHEPGQVQLRFVLALLLWRKKALRLETTAAAAEGEIWEFTNTKTGAVQRVARPELDEAQLEQLSGQLESLLAGQAEQLDRAPGAEQGAGS